MASPFSATPEGMARCAVRLDEAAKAINNIQKAVETANAEMLRTWDGRAANAFQRAMLSWNTETTDIVNALMWLRERMSEGGRSYAASEEQVQQAANDLANLNNAGVSSRPFFNGAGPR